MLNKRNPTKIMVTIFMDDMDYHILMDEQERWIYHSLPPSIDCIRNVKHTLDATNHGNEPWMEGTDEEEGGRAEKRR